MRSAAELKERVAEIFKARTPDEDTVDGWVRLAQRLETAARRSAGTIQRNALSELSSEAWERVEALRAQKR